MQSLQKLRETFIGWLDISDYSPTLQFAILGGILAFVLLGLILDWDWCLTLANNHRMRWLDGQSRRTKRIALGIMIIILIVGAWFGTIGRAN